MTAVRRDDHARAAYDVLAPLYDRFTAGHNFAAWTSQLEALARGASLTGRRLLDVGCGTGSSAEPMLRRGYDVVGVDVSEGMLARAAQRLGPDVRIECADMRALPVLGEFDLVWSVTDAVNCLLSDVDLVDAFAGFARNLAPRGLIVFDVNTLATFRALYSSLLVAHGEEGVVVLEGLADAELGPGALAEAQVDHLQPAAPPFWSRTRALLRQRHHTRERTEAALAAAGLRCAAVWGTDGAGGSERPLDDLRHNKAVYIAHRVALESERR